MFQLTILETLSTLSNLLIKVFRTGHTTEQGIHTLVKYKNLLLNSYIIGMICPKLKKKNQHSFKVEIYM